MKLNENEKKVLAVLVEYTQPNGEMCIGFSWIGDDARIERRLVRLACRSLARKGLSEFYSGLFDEDGKVAGSGYCATKKGFELMEGKQKKIEL